VVDLQGCFAVVSGLFEAFTSINQRKGASAIDSALLASEAPCVVLIFAAKAWSACIRHIGLPDPVHAKPRHFRATRAAAAAGRKAPCRHNQETRESNNNNQKRKKMAFTQKNEIELNEALNAETLSSKVLPRWQRKALAAAAKSPAARKLQASKTPGSPAVRDVAVALACPVSRNGANRVGGPATRLGDCDEHSSCTLV
jgi:hypothetical protein